MKLVPIKGSPPMPMQVDWPRPWVESWCTISYVSVPRHDADAPRLADVARDDADLALGGGDQAGAVRADQPGAPLVQERQHAGHVEDGNAFRDTDDQTEPGVGGFVDRRRRHGGGHVDHCDIRLGLAHPVRDGVEHRDYTVEQLATLSRRHPCHDLRAVADHLTGVERAVPTGDPLHEQARVLVDEDAHAFACATARFTASSMSVRAEKPALVRIAIASASFVPVSRMTSGTLIGNC